MTVLNAIQERALQLLQEITPKDAPLTKVGIPSAGGEDRLVGRLLPSEKENPSQDCWPSSIGDGWAFDIGRYFIAEKDRPAPDADKWKYFVGNIGGDLAFTNGYHCLSALDCRLTEYTLDPEFDSEGNPIPIKGMTGRIIYTKQKKEPRFQTKLWSQGSAFAFSPGYVLYKNDHSMAVHVIDAREAEPAKGSTQRDPGLVFFGVYTAASDPARQWDFARSETLSQDAFVRFLITGKLQDYLREQNPQPNTEKTPEANSQKQLSFFD
jgi:hypothetical protein